MQRDGGAWVCLGVCVMSIWTTKPIRDVIMKTPTFDPRKKPEEIFSYVDVSSVSRVELKITKAEKLKGKNAPSRARRVISKGDVIFATVRPTLKRIAVVPEYLDGEICSTGYFVFQPKPEINNRYLYYFLQTDSFMGEMEKLQSGASYPAVNDTQVKNQLINYPPIPEQKRILAILDQAFAEIDQARANAQQNINNVRELFESYLQQVFSQRGEGWVEKTVGEIGKVSMCKRVLKKQTSMLGDIPFYKIGTFGKTANAYISNDVYQEFKDKYSFPKKGEILISASGTIGRRVVYDGEPAYFQDSNIVWVENNEKFVLNEYLYQFYGVCDWNASKGATISRLYNDDLRRIKISFPSIIQQEKLVEKMVKLKEQTQTIQLYYQNKLDLLDQLKKSILQKAFTGELTKESKGVAA